MPRQRPGRSGRYDHRVIALRIERMMTDSGLLAKQVAAEVGLSEAAWSKKMHLNQSSFTLEELGRVADAFSRLTHRKLIGWPFIDADLSDQLGR